MLVLCGLPRLELLQQGQARAAREGRPVRRRSASAPPAAQGRGRCSRLAARQDPVHPHRRAAAVREPGDPRVHRGRAIPSRRCCRRIRSRGEGARAGRPSSTCTSSWSRASSTRRRSSAARVERRQRGARAQAARAQHRRASSAWRASRRMSPAPTFTQADCAAWAEPAAGRDGDARSSTAKTCSSPAASTGRRTQASSASGRARRRSPPTARPSRIVLRPRPDGAGRRPHRQAGWAPASGAAAAATAAAAAAAIRGRHFLAVAVELLHAREAALHQQAQVVQDALDDLVLPDRVELDLLVEPVLEPLRVGQAALDRVAREQRLC